MKETYQKWNPSKESAYLIQQITLILEDYEKKGYQLTLRQLYYQLVSRDIIPNTVREYARIGNVVNRGRLAGFIDWSMIEDRTRTPVLRPHWSSPKEMMNTAINMYYIPKWEDQANYIEVWCEKDAVSNIIQPVCRRWGVTFMANRGYSSQSAMYEASQRLYNAHADGKYIGVIYLGDHDPSGIDMTRDIEDRLGIFLNEGNSFGAVARIALNMDQIDQYKPPENPAKVTDSRFQGYAKVYGYSSWELDALKPEILDDLVDNKIREFIDFDLWRKVEEVETNQRHELMAIAEGLED